MFPATDFFFLRSAGDDLVNPAEKTSENRKGRAAGWTWVNLHHRGPGEPWIDPAGQKC